MNMREFFGQDTGKEAKQTNKQKAPGNTNFLLRLKPTKHDAGAFSVLWTICLASHLSFSFHWALTFYGFFSVYLTPRCALYFIYTFVVCFLFQFSHNTRDACIKQESLKDWVCEKSILKLEEKARQLSKHSFPLRQNSAQKNCFPPSKELTF